MFTPDGNRAISYNKHEPVPGEPSVPENETIRAVDAAGVRLGGAICYDYDFPYLPAEHSLTLYSIVGDIWVYVCMVYVV